MGVYLLGLAATGVAVGRFVVTQGHAVHATAIGIGIVGLGVMVLVVVLLLSRPGQVHGTELTRAGIVAALDAALRTARAPGQVSGVFAVELDHYKQLEERQSHDARAALLATCRNRLTGLLDHRDLAVRLEGPCFLIAAAPERCATLEEAIRFASSVQATLSAPIRLPSGNVYPSFSIGFALPDRLDADRLRPEGVAAAPTAAFRSGEALVQAAMSAMIEAQRSGPGAVRSFSRAMFDRIEGRRRLSGQVADALRDGQIRPFFQPQTATATGRLTGFETLARWHHPERGMIPPSEFLPAIEEAGLMDGLGHLMTREALSAMRHWEDAGLVVPQVGVNFSTHELSDPDLADHIAAELAAQGLAPARLTIEVLETVVAGQRDDMVARNLSRLAAMGCRLDLDDFGTGHASITSIRRFSIARIKIDRTFVSRIDEDAEQQDMVAAILTMAERLGLEALAEGVETDAEHAMLRKLGCAYVQGFGIARPMPLSETDAWIAAHAGRLPDPVQLRARSA